MTDDRTDLDGRDVDGPRRAMKSRLRTLAVAAALVVPLLVWQDHRSLERGNRLYRDGDPSSAAELYRMVEGRERQTGRAGYNLGTALMGQAPDSAAEFFQTATQGEDRVVAQRGFYNLGYQSLTTTQGPMGPDSSVIVLSEAIEHNRAALRLDPTDESARWNLALAQRRLDALMPPGEQAQRESAGTSDDELVIEDQALARSETADAVSGLEPEDPRAANNTGERQGSREGAREAWASQDPGPLSRTAAFSLLDDIEDDPESLIRGILWSHRPDIAWWESQPYPGGGW